MKLHGHLKDTGVTVSHLREQGKPGARPGGWRQGEDESLLCDYVGTCWGEREAVSYEGCGSDPVSYHYLFPRVMAAL